MLTPSLQPYANNFRVTHCTNIQGLSKKHCFNCISLRNYIANFNVYGVSKCSSLGGNVLSLVSLLHEKSLIKIPYTIERHVFLVKISQSWIVFLEIPCISSHGLTDVDFVCNMHFRKIGFDRNFKRLTSLWRQRVLCN